MDRYHWYMSNQNPKADKQVGEHYGYKDEPPYEVIEKYDLRKVSFENLDELFRRYF